ncbi:MAG: hypothetical protein RI964_2043 [Pseudomonadota bacterium]|jgi:uncharacterized protein
MKFSEDKGDARYRITGYGEGWVGVNQEQLRQSFIIMPDQLITDWQPQHINELTAAHLQPLFAMNAQIILLGSGTTQQFPQPEVWHALVQNGIGFEIMSTDAACRTYHLLSSEDRRVVAAFFP